MTSSNAEGQRHSAAMTEGRGRNPREQACGADVVTGRMGHSWPKAMDVMEAVVERENKWVSYHCLINCTIYNVLHEPPDTEPYVRWCGRPGSASSPPTRSSGAIRLKRQG